MCRAIIKIWRWGGVKRAYLAQREHVPLTAHLVLKVSSGDPNMLPDSLALDSIPVEPLDSDIENWF